MVDRCVVGSCKILQMPHYATPLSHLRCHEAMMVNACVVLKRFSDISPPFAETIDMVAVVP